MAISRLELVETVHAASLLLDALLDAYRFTVEPREEGWALQVEYVDRGTWGEVEIPIDERLRASVGDENLQRALLAEWRSLLPVRERAGPETPPPA